jgi:hypothetical protein
MKRRLNITVPHDKISEFCRKNFIKKLLFFGSVLREDFGPESDVDVLVEFEEGLGPGFFGLAHMERELTEIVGKKVDIRTPGELSKYFRDEVLASAVEEYVQR